MLNQFSKSEDIEERQQIKNVSEQLVIKQSKNTSQVNKLSELVAFVSVKTSR